VRSRCGGGEATLQSFDKGKERKYFQKKNYVSDLFLGNLALF